VIEMREGHVLEVLGGMEAGSVQCCVTSPPYWGLRDYGLEPVVWGGRDPACEHKWVRTQKPPDDKKCEKCNGAGWLWWQELDHDPHKDELGAIIDDTQYSCDSCRGTGWQGVPAKEPTDTCPRCRAWRGSLGLEPTVEFYVEHITEVFRGVRRVLRPDGCVFLNLGDSYAAAGYSRQDNTGGATRQDGGKQQHTAVPSGLKPKDLIGVPWRVAFALQADGWWLRSAVVWAKGVSMCPTYAGSVMPESCTDRPTSAYEMVFLLTKSARYFYDATAVKEANSATSHTGGQYVNEWKYAAIKDTRSSGMRVGVPIPRNGRNLRNVWCINPQAFREAHFATFPEKLAETCVKAGSSHKACGACGAPWERVVETERTFESGSGKAGNMPEGKNGPGLQGGGETGDVRRGPCVHTTTTGFQPTCKHDDGMGRSLVLDPFAGSGTVGVVCKRLGRDFLGIEMNPDYCEMARKRLARPVTQEMFA